MAEEKQTDDIHTELSEATAEPIFAKLKLKPDEISALKKCADISDEVLEEGVKKGRITAAEYVQLKNFILKPLRTEHRKINLAEFVAIKEKHSAKYADRLAATEAEGYKRLNTVFMDVSVNVISAACKGTLKVFQEDGAACASHNIFPGCQLIFTAACGREEAFVTLKASRTDVRLGDTSLVFEVSIDGVPTESWTCVRATKWQFSYTRFVSEEFKNFFDEAGSAGMADRQVISSQRDSNLPDELKYINEYNRTCAHKNGPFDYEQMQSDYDAFKYPLECDECANASTLKLKEKADSAYEDRSRCVVM
jgi:hypothetical protein